MTPRVLFYVMHLQGIGHVVRASRISQKLAEDGFAVTLVLGGMPLDAFAPSGVEIVQLAPLRMAPDSYRELLKGNGEPIDDAYKAERYALLMATLERTNSDIVMVEAYPFDRPQMHFELVPFLAAAKRSSPRPLIVSSIRDILQRKDKPERDDITLERLHTFFDHILIHGDPRLATLGETFRHAEIVESMIHYTGVIAPPPFVPIENPRYDVIVTAGGGTTGKLILEAAIAAKPNSPFADDRWLVTLGHNIPSQTMEAVRTAGESGNVEVVDFLSELGRHLAHAKLSISQCGYNTSVDLLRAGCPAVLCPFSGAKQNEQLRRAELMSDRGLAVMIREDELTPEALVRTMHQALQLSRRAIDIDLSGAANTARKLRELLVDHRSQ